MRTLIYVPVIHSSADLGSLAKEVTRRGVADFGPGFWKEHEETIQGFWDAVIAHFDAVGVSGFKLYQDGMIAGGEIARKIVAEGVRAGSKNYELVADLVRKGAVLVKTEDFQMVKEERDRLLRITQAKTLFGKLLGFLRYRLGKNRLLRKRDGFIAQTIAQTLGHGETGILFIGAYHDVQPRLPADIRILELKDTGRVREYQELLPFYHRRKERFAELTKYLASEIPAGSSGA